MVGIEVSTVWPCKRWNACANFNSGEILKIAQSAKKIASHNIAEINSPNKTIFKFNANCAGPIILNVRTLCLIE